MMGRSALGLALFGLLFALLGTPAANAQPGNAMTKSMSAEEFQRIACGIFAADAPFTRAVYRGEDAVTRAQFNRRFPRVTKEARGAEAAYNRMLSSTSHHPFHRSVRKQVRKLLEVTDRQREDLFRLGYVTRRPGAWNEFNDWRDRNPNWSRLAKKIMNRLDLKQVRC